MSLTRQASLTELTVTIDIARHHSAIHNLCYYVPVLYLITHDLVNKLSNSESTYPERVDDVRGEMINKIDMGVFGSRLSLVGQEAWYF